MKTRRKAKRQLHSVNHEKRECHCAWVTVCNRTPRPGCLVDPPRSLHRHAFPSLDQAQLRIFRAVACIRSSLGDLQQQAVTWQPPKQRALRPGCLVAPPRSLHRHALPSLDSSPLRISRAVACIQSASGQPPKQDPEAWLPSGSTQIAPQASTPVIGVILHCAFPELWLVSSQLQVICSSRL